MYRTRLGGRLDNVISEYVSSINDDTVIARYDILGSIAHVIMLKDCKILSKSDAARILGALLKIKPESLSDTHSAEDIHELIETKVIKNSGDAGRRMHTARSRNDQVSLDIRMKLRDDINLLCSLAVKLVDSILNMAAKHTKTIMPLYTHLQHAQYGTLSHYMIAYADTLLRDIDRLSQTYVRINQSPLGAGAIGGTSMKINRHQTAKLLGFEKIVENSIDATSSRDHVAEYVANVAIMMTNLSRMAEDFVIWSTSEFSFIELGDATSSPSSVMPQKKNPDVLELTRSKAADTIGYLVSVLGSSKGLATGYGRDLQQSKLPAWSATRTGIGALGVMRLVILGMAIDKKRMTNAATFGYLDALEIVETLVLKNSIPFREAHSIVAKLVRIAHDSSIKLDELSGDQIHRVCGTKNSKVNNSAIQYAIKHATAQKALERRSSTGSSGFAQQSRMIRARVRTLGIIKKKIADRERHVNNTYASLEKKARLTV